MNGRVGVRKEELKMEYDHLIVPGMNYRRSKEDIMKDVRADAAEWHNREFKGTF